MISTFLSAPIINGTLYLKEAMANNTCFKIVSGILIQPI